MISANKILAVLCLCAAPAYAQVPLYDIIDLGPIYTLGYEHQDLKLRINDNNQTAGWTRLANSSKSPIKGFIADSAGNREFIDNVDSLPNAVLGLNNNNVLVGWSEDAAQVRRATSWSLDAGLNWVRNTVTIPGAVSSQAADINDNGTLVGDYRTATPDAQHAFSWNAGSGLADLVPASSSSYASAIEGNFIVGQFRNANGTGHGFLIDAAQTLTDLGALGAATNYSIASEVNANAVVVGGAQTDPLFNCSRACFGKVHGMVWDQANGMQDMFPSLGSYWLDGINDSNTIVGWAEVVTNTYGGKAIIVENGVAYDLNELATNAADWHLERAHDINEAGYIVGLGQYQSQRHGFMLVPTSVNASVVDLEIAQVDSTTVNKVNNRVGTDTKQPYRISVKNNGPNGATAVAATATIPDAVSLEIKPISQGVCVATTRNHLDCTIGDMAVGQSALFDVVATASVDGEYAVKFSVQSNEKDTGVLNNNELEVRFKITGSVASPLPDITTPDSPDDGAATAQPQNDETGSTTANESTGQNNAPSSGQKSGVGCSLSSGRGSDPTFVVLTLFAIVFLCRGRRVRTSKCFEPPRRQGRQVMRGLLRK